MSTRKPRTYATGWAPLPTGDENDRLAHMDGPRSPIELHRRPSGRTPSAGEPGARRTVRLPIVVLVPATVLDHDFGFREAGETSPTASSSSAQTGAAAIDLRVLPPRARLLARAPRVREPAPVPERNGGRKPGGRRFRLLRCERPTEERRGRPSVSTRWHGLLAGRSSWLPEAADVQRYAARSRRSPSGSARHSFEGFRRKPHHPRAARERRLGFSLDGAGPRQHSLRCGQARRGRSAVHGSHCARLLRPPLDLLR